MANFYRHIFISGNVKTEKYKIKGNPVTPKPLPVRDRATHSTILLQKFDALWFEMQNSHHQREAQQIPTKEGTYLSFTSQSNHDLITKSLEDLGKGIRLLNVKEVTLNDNETQIQATIYIPKGKESHFVNKIQSYQSKNVTNVHFFNQQNHDFIKAVINQFNDGIHILKIRDAEKGGIIRTKASIVVPVGSEDHFIEEFNKLELQADISIATPNATLVNSIEDVRIALLESFWTDQTKLVPNEDRKWCEVWLSVNTKEQREQEQIATFKATLENIGIEYKANTIIFPERAVLLIHANRSQLIELMLQSDLLAEFRSGQEPASFWTNESIIDQQAWTENLLQRIEVIDSQVKVCVLDTGVNNGHQLLQPVLDDANTLTVNQSWGTSDHERGSGHGTLMAGLTAYGNLEEALISINNISLTHQLCSVKILPPANQEETPKELWGDITAQGISRAEIQNPRKTLIYCMAVTSADDANRGRPSSSSGAVDNLVFSDGENQKFSCFHSGINGFKLNSNLTNQHV